MKTLFCMVVGLWVAAAAYGQQPVPPAASTAEVLAGTDPFKYVTPAGLAAAGFGAPTNGVTPAQAETINRNSDASGTNVFAGNGRNLTNVYAQTVIPNGLQTNQTFYGGLWGSTTNWAWTKTNREPFWTYVDNVESFNQFGFSMREADGSRWLFLRDAEPTEHVVYIGDVDGTNKFQAVSLRVASTNIGNTEPRITFVFGSGNQGLGDVSWNMWQHAFGYDYLDVDTFDHVQIPIMRYDLTNVVTVGGSTNYQLNLAGTNIVALTNLTVAGTFYPTNGIIGNRPITTNANPQLDTLYTNGLRRGVFTTSLELAPDNQAIGARIVTYNQDGTGTNFWAEVYHTDGAGAFDTHRSQLTAWLNPSQVWYVENLGGGGTISVRTNTWKLVNE